MKTLKDKVSGIILIILIGLALSSCKDKKADAASSQYTCPMHPEVLKEEPGTCPICNMDLVSTKHEDLHAAVEKDLQDVLLPSNEVVLSDVTTIKAAYDSLGDTLTLKGTINYNTNNQRSVSSYISGRIERLYVSYNFEQV